MAGILEQLNYYAFRAAAAMASPQLNLAMRVLAFSYVAVLMAVAAYLFIRRDKNAPAFVFAIFALYAVGELLKLVFREPRPCSLPSLSWINSIGCSSTFSFPSAHAVTLTGLILFMGKYRKMLALYAVWLALVLFGRVYLGMHYLTDVIAGVAISLAVAYLIFAGRKRIGKAFARLLRVIHK